MSHLFIRSDGETITAFSAALLSGLTLTALTAEVVIAIKCISPHINGAWYHIGKLPMNGATTMLLPAAAYALPALAALGFTIKQHKQEQRAKACPQELPDVTRS